MSMSKHQNLMRAPRAIVRCMPLLGVALIVSFLETVLTIMAGLVPLSKRFRSPVELLLFFVNPSVF